MSQIDWSKAPEWADAHGDVHCITTRNIWFNDNVYMYVGDSRSYQWMDLSTDLIHNHGRRSVTNIQARPVPWTGEGLPPVGIDVEIHNKSGRGVVEGAESFIGTTCKVLATFVNMNGYEMVSVEDSGGSCMCFRADTCGPIRTPEQIAAKVRDKAAEELYLTINWASTAYEWANLSSGRREDYFKAIDAGYRKFEIVEN
jgi:hypothetical protein